MMKLNNPLERVRDVIHSGMGKTSWEGRSLVYLNLDQLDPNPFQPRENLNGPAMEELCESIRQSGVLEPILIRRKEDRYEIISGERRWRACQRLELQEIPCILKEASDAESFQLALTENLQRNNLTPMEEARAFRRMLELKIARNQTEIGRLLGIRQQRVSDKLRLMQLPLEVQAYFHQTEHQDRLSQKHGEILAKLGDPDQIREVAQRILQDQLSTRETLRLIEKLKKRSSEATRKVRPARRIHVLRKRHGFTLKFSFDTRRDTLEEALLELAETAEKLRKEFAAREAQKNR